ncbi:porin [Marinobacter bohaiensis]|uniref:porin n=1 Tax=Marinobacter bohaiensis TaxID=2201898 RepID=UPI000DADF523|nr:porin [Marinobacter bohaiensis]
MFVSKKKTHRVSALVLTLGLSGAGAAQALPVYQDDDTRLDLYGRIHLTMNDVDGETYMSQSQSRIGINARREINDKVVGYARAEFRFVANDRNEAKPNVISDIRNTYLGMHIKDIGDVKAGNFSSIYYTNLSKVINVRQSIPWRAFAKTTTRAAGNSISFDSSDFSGFRFGVAHKFNNEEDDEADAGNTMGYLSYQVGKVRLSAGYDQAEDDDDSLFGASITYDVLPELSLRGLYEHQGDMRHYGVATVFDYSQGEIYSNASYMENDSLDQSDIQYLGGVSYRLARQMLVYFEYTNSSRTEINAIDESWGAVGFRYDF